MTKNVAHAFTTLAAIATLAAAGCAHTPANSPSGPSATARLAPTRGNAVEGTVTFTQVASGVHVKGEVRGLPAGSERGFHIHEKGDCSSGDGMSTGGHYNPAGASHGRHGAGAHHAGDLPSLKADASGVARIDFTAAGLGVGSGNADVVGRGLIVHAAADDYTTQPTGNAGARVACAVIQR